MNRSFLLPIALTVLAPLGWSQGGSFTKLPMLPPHGGLAPGPWVTTFGGTGFESADEVVSRIGGGFYSAGHVRSSGAGGADAWVARLRPGGKAVWERAYGGKGDDQAWCLLATPDGGCVFAGYTSSFGAGAEDAWVVKLAQDGSIDWQHAFGGTGSDHFSAIDASPNGYYVGGTITDAGGNQDAWVLELDFAGNPIWQETFGGKGSDRLRALSATADGVAISIDSNSTLAGKSVSFFRPWLIRLDTSGKSKWQRVYDFSGGDSWTDLVALSGGGFVATGEVIAAGFFQGDAWVVRLNDTGTILWEAHLGDHFNTPGWDYGEQILETPDGGFVISGMTETAGNFADLWMIGLDSAGTLQWERTIGGKAHDLGHGICLAGPKSAVISGSSSSFGAGSADAFLMRLPLGGVNAGACDLSQPTNPNEWQQAPSVSIANLPPTQTAAVAQVTKATITPLGTQVFWCGF